MPMNELVKIAVATYDSATHYNGRNDTLDRLAKQEDEGKLCDEIITARDEAARESQTRKTESRTYHLLRILSWPVYVRQKKVTPVEAMQTLSEIRLNPPISNSLVGSVGSAVTAFSSYVGITKTDYKTEMDKLIKASMSQVQEYEKKMLQDAKNQIDELRREKSEFITVLTEERKRQEAAAPGEMVSQLEQGLSCERTLESYYELARQCYPTQSEKITEIYQALHIFRRYLSNNTSYHEKRPASENLPDQQTIRTKLEELKQAVADVNGGSHVGPAVSHFCDVAERMLQILSSDNMEKLSHKLTPLECNLVEVLFLRTSEHAEKQAKQEPEIVQIKLEEAKIQLQSDQARIEETKSQLQTSQRKLEQLQMKLDDQKRATRLPNQVVSYIIDGLAYQENLKIAHKALISIIDERKPHQPQGVSDIYNALSIFSQYLTTSEEKQSVNLPNQGEIVEKIRQLREYVNSNPLRQESKGTLSFLFEKASDPKTRLSELITQFCDAAQAMLGILVPAKMRNLPRNLSEREIGMLDVRGMVQMQAIDAALQQKQNPVRLSNIRQ